MIIFYILSKRFFLKRKGLSFKGVTLFTEKTWFCSILFIKIQKYSKSILDEI